jgi:uncharacterized membrane protein YraQ (UPF0718 family)
VDVATLILVLLAVVLMFIAYRRGDGSHNRAIRLGWQTLRRTLPLLIVAFIIVGYVNALQPQVLVRSWLGPGTGLKGLLVGAIAGMLLPGGPYVVFPLISAIYLSGAGLGPTLAMITSWSTLALLSVSFELPFLGWRFSLLRLSLGLPIPLLVGLAAHLLRTSL